eukprot:12222067-Alexandrium_andersonii.AAC.1
MPSLAEGRLSHSDGVELLSTPPASGQGELGRPPGIGLSAGRVEYSARHRSRHRAKPDFGRAH